MIIRRIQTENFMTHEHRELVLPARGIVMITGENGVGKSAFIEGVAYALWGKTLRGTSPWRDGVAGAVTVETDKLTVKRTIDANGKERVVWAPTGETLGKADTPAKTQKVLDAHIPLQSVWRYGTVLSASDSQRFTLASDAERKELLETMLSLPTTEPAVKALRVDLSAKRTELTGIENRLAVLEATIAGALKRIEDCATAIPDSDVALPTQESVIADGKAVGVRIAELELEARRVAEALQEARRVATTAALHLAAHQKMATLQGAACVTCGRALDGQYAAHVAEVVTPQIAKLEVESASAAAAVESLVTEQAAIVTSAREQTAVRDGLRLQLRTIQDRARFDSEQAARKVRAEEERRAAEIERGEKTTRREALEHEIKLLELAETVLDTRGLRTYLLAGALDALTLVANSWMARIANPDFRVVLKPFSDSGVKNAISIDVLGTGGGRGYKANSGGQRKRIDLAILFALGELSRRSYAEDVGTLWFDEAFDQLDVPGIEAIVEVLKELAEHRCVVVIAHREILIDALRGHARRVHITESGADSTSHSKHSKS